MNQDIEKHVKDGFTWQKLLESVKLACGNSEQEYNHALIEFSIKHQVRYRVSSIRHVIKNEKAYYERLLEYSKKDLMLYPYHLQERMIGLRVTSFSYYISMMEDLMKEERSYDSLPNFTAADGLRLLGIGRNQFIELMNNCRSTKKFSFRRKPQMRDFLPKTPVAVNIEPWWTVRVGFITEDDIKLCTSDLKSCIDRLIDEGPMVTCTIDREILKKLYTRGLVMLDVPIKDDTKVIVPPLEGFVMNRVLGDYFETLLYKIFVSIDEHTTMTELSTVLDISLELVKNAVSVFCRLGFARLKEHFDVNGQQKAHKSWKESKVKYHLKVMNDLKQQGFLTIPKIIENMVKQGEVDGKDSSTIPKIIENMCQQGEEYLSTVFEVKLHLKDFTEVYRTLLIQVMNDRNLQQWFEDESSPKMIEKLHSTPIPNRPTIVDVSDSKMTSQLNERFLKKKSLLSASSYRSTMSSCRGTDRIMLYVTNKTLTYIFTEKKKFNFITVIHDNHETGQKIFLELAHDRNTSMSLSSASNVTTEIDWILIVNQYLISRIVRFNLYKFTYAYKSRTVDGQVGSFIAVVIYFTGGKVTLYLNEDFITNNELKVLDSKNGSFMLSTYYTFIRSLVAPEQKFDKRLEIRIFDSFLEPTESYVKFYDLLKCFYGPHINIIRYTYEKNQKENECGYRTIYQLLHYYNKGNRFDCNHATRIIHINVKFFEKLCKICDSIIGNNSGCRKKLSRREIKKIIIKLSNQGQRSSVFTGIYTPSEFFDHSLKAFENCDQYSKLSIVNTEDIPGEHWYLAQVNVKNITQRYSTNY